MDWIKMRVDLHRHPKTIRMKRLLPVCVEMRSDVSANFIVGCLLVVWGTINSVVSPDDICAGMEIDDIDEIAGFPGFGRAMVVCGWAAKVPDGVAFPNFREFNTPESSRTPPLTNAQRQKRYRERNVEVTDTVTESNEANVTRVVTSNAERIREDTIGEETKGKEKTKTRLAAFVKPDTEEVRRYCFERQNTVDPEAFVDFYESKGWKVGREAMKDWKASVRTWEKNRMNGSNGKGKPGLYDGLKEFVEASHDQK